MKIRLSLSTKADTNGFREILLMIQPYIRGKVVSLRAKSSILVKEEFFDKDNGVKSLSRKYLNTPDVVYHREQGKRIVDMVNFITDEYQSADLSDMCKDWLKDVVDNFLHPEKYMEPESEKKSFAQLGEEYLNHKPFSIDHTKGCRVLLRCVARYEGYVQATDRKRKDFVFDADTITKETIEDFRDYLGKEHELAEKKPKLFEKLLDSYPANLKGGYRSVQPRGSNAVFKLMKKLKAIFNWLYETGRTKNQPFVGVKLGGEKFGTPYYISIEERNKIADIPMPTKHLEVQRDVFIFQCFIGCRVSDLIKLTDDMIVDGVLSYTPHKTKDEGQQAVVARIPLHPKAQALIEKYKGVDEKGRLMPFISPQKYNDAIKEVFTIAGITRPVEVRNALTGEMEIRPINEIASSHMARRTFIGNSYFKVQDPSLIAAMSGHTEGSRAFSRYRKIEDETLKSVIDLIG